MTHKKQKKAWRIIQIQPFGETRLRSRYSSTQPSVASQNAMLSCIYLFIFVLSFCYGPCESEIKCNDIQCRCKLKIDQDVIDFLTLTLMMSSGGSEAAKCITDGLFYILICNSVCYKAALRSHFVNI